MNAKHITSVLLIIGTFAWSAGSVVAQNNAHSSEAGTTSAPAPDAQVFGRGVGIVENIIPGSLKNAVSTAFSTLEHFRTNEHLLVEIARFDNIDEIDALNKKETHMIAVKGTHATTTPTFLWQDHVERLLRYVYWACLVVASTILARVWLFYIVLFLVAWTLLRMVWRRIRGTSDF